MTMILAVLACASASAARAPGYINTRLAASRGARHWDQLSALSAQRAREIAAEMHAQTRLGRDPSGEKAESRVRAAETMDAVLQNYLAFQRGRLKPRSMIELERHLLKNCKSLHGLQLAKIDRRG